MCGAFVRYIPLPPHIDGVTLPNDDATFDVYINSQNCPKKQLEAIRHEIQHIKLV